MSHRTSAALCTVALGLGRGGRVAWRARRTPPRIVSVGSSLTEIVYALGAENLLVGVDTTSLYPAAARGAAAGRLHARAVGRGRAVAEADA